MDAGKLLTVEEELVAFHVPGDIAGIRHDLPGVRRSNEALLLFLKVPGVGERQCGARLFEYFQGVH